MGPANDLTTTVLSSNIALAPFLLAAKLFPKRAALSFVRVYMPVNCFVADKQESCNLLRTPLELRCLTTRSRLWINLKDIMARLRTCLTKQISLSGSITSQARITQNLSADCRLMPTQYLGNRLKVLSCFHKGGNLITFSLAKMFIDHDNLRLADQEALNTRTFFVTQVN